MVVDVGANVGMAAFAAAVMGFRVVAFEPVFENLQRICDGVYLNRVQDQVVVYHAAASDRAGNITMHKVSSLLQIAPFKSLSTTVILDCSSKYSTVLTRCLLIEMYLGELDEVLW